MEIHYFCSVKAPEGSSPIAQLKIHKDFAFPVSSVDVCLVFDAK